MAAAAARGKERAPVAHAPPPPAQAGSGEIVAVALPQGRPHRQLTPPVRSGGGIHPQLGERGRARDGRRRIPPADDLRGPRRAGPGASLHPRNTEPAARTSGRATEVHRPDAWSRSVAAKASQNRSSAARVTVSGGWTRTTSGALP